MVITPELSVAFGSTQETAKSSLVSIYWVMLPGHVLPKLGGSSSVIFNDYLGTMQNLYVDGAC